MGAVIPGRMELLQRDADLADGEGGSRLLQLCCPKARPVPRDLCLHWVGVAALLPCSTETPAHPQEEAELLLQGWQDIGLFFIHASKQPGSRQTRMCSIPPQIVPQVSMALPTDQNWLVGDQAGPAPALGTGAVCDGSVPAGA